MNLDGKVFTSCGSLRCLSSKSCEMYVEFLPDRDADKDCATHWPRAKNRGR